MKATQLIFCDGNSTQSVSIYTKNSEKIAKALAPLVPLTAKLTSIIRMITDCDMTTAYNYAAKAHKELKRE